MRLRKVPFWIPLLAALPLALTALAQDFTPIDITEISPPITEAPDTPTPPPLLPTPPGMPETPVPEIGSTATLFAVSEDMIATLPPPQVVEPLADLRDAAEMHPAFYDDFSTFDPIEMRYAGRGFARVSYPGLGLALNLYERDQPVTVQTDVWLDVSAEARFLLEGGAARIFVRRSDAGHYSARVNAEGLIELFRGDQRLTWGQISAGEDRRLRLTALGDHLSVLVDGAVVLEYVDPSPLPSGSVALMAQDFRQNGALADEIGIWTTEPQAPPVPVFAAAPLSGTPTPVFLPAPQGLPDYTTLLLSQNEALYAGPQVGLYNQPLHFVDRSGVEQRLTLLPAIASGHIEIMYPDLAVSPDGDWGAVICGSSYEFIADVCVIGLTGDDAGKIKPMYGEMSGGVDAYSDSVPRWSSDASGGLWINFSSDRYGDTGRVRRLHFEPEAWRAMTVLPTTPPESLNLTLCTDVTTVDVWILCVNRDAAQPDVAAYRFNSSTGEKLPLLYTSQVSSSLRGLDAVVVPGGERLVAYVLYNGPCSTAPGCAVGWSRFSSDPAFTRLSGGNTSFQTAAHYLTPHLNPSGNRALVEQHVFGVNDQSVIFDLTVPNEPPKAVTIQHSNYLGVDWGKLHPCQIVATKSCSFHTYSESLGLPLPFQTAPVTDILANGYRQGYGPTTFARRYARDISSTTFYEGTHQVHPGIDFTGFPNQPVLAVCDGIVVGTGSTGAYTGYSIAVRCFDNGRGLNNPTTPLNLTHYDIDGDGLANLSNIVITYNHLREDLVGLGSTLIQSNPRIYRIVREGELLGYTAGYYLTRYMAEPDEFRACIFDADGIPDDCMFPRSGHARTGCVDSLGNNECTQLAQHPVSTDHLHLEVIIARGGYQHFSGPNAIRINPLLVFSRGLVDQFTQPGIDTYFPVLNAPRGQSIVTFPDPLGLNPGDIDEFSQEADLGDTDPRQNGFFELQIPEPASVVEWWRGDLGPMPFTGVSRMIEELGFFMLNYGYPPSGSNRYYGPNCLNSPPIQGASYGGCQFEWIDRNGQGSTAYLGYQVDIWDPLAPAIWPNP